MSTGKKPEVSKQEPHLFVFAGPLLPLVLAGLEGGIPWLLAELLPGSELGTAVSETTPKLFHEFMSASPSPLPLCSSWNWPCPGLGRAAQGPVRDSRGLAVPKGSQEHPLSHQAPDANQPCQLGMLIALLSAPLSYHQQGLIVTALFFICHPNKRRRTKPTQIWSPKQQTPQILLGVKGSLWKSSHGNFCSDIRQKAEPSWA